MKWARVVNSIAVEVISFSPEGRYHPDLVWTQCPDDCEQHWLYDGTDFTAPPAEVAPPVVLVDTFSEEEVAALLADGYTSEQIASELPGNIDREELDDLVDVYLTSE